MDERMIEQMEVDAIDGALPVTMMLLEQMAMLEEGAAGGMISTDDLDAAMTPVLLRLAALERRDTIRTMEQDLGIALQIRKLDDSVARMRAAHSEVTPEVTEQVTPTRGGIIGRILGRG